MGKKYGTKWGYSPWWEPIPGLHFWEVPEQMWVCDHSSAKLPRALDVCLFASKRKSTAACVKFLGPGTSPLLLFLLSGTPTWARFLHVHLLKLSENKVADRWSPSLCTVPSACISGRVNVSPVTSVSAKKSLRHTSLPLQRPGQELPSACASFSLWTQQEAGIGAFQLESVRWRDFRVLQGLSQGQLDVFFTLIRIIHSKPEKRDWGHSRYFLSLQSMQTWGWGGNCEIYSLPWILQKELFLYKRLCRNMPVFVYSFYHFGCWLIELL